MAFNFLKKLRAAFSGVQNNVDHDIPQGDILFAELLKMVPAEIKGKIHVMRRDAVIRRMKDIKPVAVLSLCPGLPAKPFKKVARIVLPLDLDIPSNAAADIKRGIAFVLKHIAQGDIIIHCELGSTRSPTMALAALATLYPTDTSEELAKKLIDIKPPKLLIAKNSLKMIGQMTGREESFSSEISRACSVHSGKKPSVAHTSASLPA